MKRKNVQQEEPPNETAEESSDELDLELPELQNMAINLDASDEEDDFEALHPYNGTDTKSDDFENSEQTTKKDFEIKEYPLFDNSTVHSFSTPLKIKEIPEEKVDLGLGNTIDEYEEDSSDEEDLRNTTGNVPINWYDEYPHIGYDLDGNQVIKPEKSDTLQNVLDRLEDPDFGRTILDKQTGKKVILSDSDLNLIRRVMKHKAPDSSINMYEQFPDLYSHEVEEMPLSGRPEHKRSFIPSKSERAKVAHLANLMKKGIYRKTKKAEPEKYYDIWKPQRNKNDFLPSKKIFHISKPIPCPKLPLPGHGASYNPLPEYKMGGSDEMKLLKSKDQKESQKLVKNVQARRYNSIRMIPRYEKAYQELQRRLYDITQVARQATRRVVAKAKDLLPKSLPKILDLRPYPTMEELVFEGHRSIIRSISVHSSGKLLASGSDDHTVKFWEVNTGRCLRSIDVDGAVKCIAWNPNPELFFVAVAMENMVVMINPESYIINTQVIKATNAAFTNLKESDKEVPVKLAAAVTWRKPTLEEYSKGYRVVLDHFQPVKQITWQKQGDYFATLMPEGISRSVLIHQLSKWRSHQPFSKNKGYIQKVAFHPVRPEFYVATLAHIRVYQLKRKHLEKKIKANCRQLATFDIHPKGEHFVIGSYDLRVNWFEYELTKRPHLLRFHKEAIRAVAFHSKYPLFATAGDDAKVVVTHATVYDDWNENPLVVPVKQLLGHRKFDDLCVLDLQWHPLEPYLFTAGADGTIRLWH